MGRKPKETIVAELIAKGIEFDRNSKYNELVGLLKGSTMEEARYTGEGMVLNETPVIQAKEWCLTKHLKR